MSGDSERDAPYQHPITLDNLLASYCVSPLLKGVVKKMEEQLKQKDKEIEQLNAALDAKITICGDERVYQLQAKLAMCVTLLNNVTFKGDYLECQDTNGKNWFDLRQDVITVTEQDVTKWHREMEAKAIEEIYEQAIRTTNGFIHYTIVKALAQQKRSEGC